MKATTFRLVWYIIWDVGNVDISHPRLANYTLMRRSAVLCTYVWQASFLRDGMNADAAMGQAVRNTCSFSRLKYWMSDHHLVQVCSLSRSFVPPFFRQLILPTNAMATVAVYLAFFVLDLGKFSIRMLQSERIQSDGRLCCGPFMYTSYL